MKKIFKRLSLMAIFAFAMGLTISCSKPVDSIPANVPHTNPMPDELVSQWLMTTSGTTYKYDGVYFGSSGHGVEVTMKKDGTGWWNDINQVATPGCVLVQNLSIDCTFEVRHESNRDQLYVYIVNGTLHEESCTNPNKDIDLKANGKTYPVFPPMIYDYKIVNEDGKPSQKLILLSQQTDPAKRFDARLDDKLQVLKKQ